ncbi:CTD kinase subunit gamma [Plectosphaerella plurivora]|uniref:CTD kinase subunit gamma n=1 Tax=Plectosphaerella plurivora TaxID=936078 RepID=A0A9P9A889_9PEZI|nr:CTD kinase subunit gamma [Plectosphaerella plurivora]
MADPFEVRMRFSNQLGQLSASVVSLQKAATYALKFKDMDEDLHSCILEQVERQTNMNTRANIMFFIEHFLEMAAKEGQTNYVKMIQRDILRIVDAVAPDTGPGAANVKVARLVLQGLQKKGFLEAQTVASMEEALKDRETSAHDAGLASPARDENDLGDMPPSQTIPRPGRASGPRLEKRHVEQRIEEDRERHKRVRENVWAIRDSEDEIDRLWEETSDLGEDDHVMGREEFLAREAAISQQCAHYSPRTLDDLYGRNGSTTNGKAH